MDPFVPVFPSGISTSNLDSQSAVVLLTPLKRPVCVLISYSYFTVMVGNSPTSVMR